MVRAHFRASNAVGIVLHWPADFKDVWPFSEWLDWLEGYTRRPTTRYRAQLHQPPAISVIVVLLWCLVNASTALSRVPLSCKPSGRLACMQVSKLEDVSALYRAMGPGIRDHWGSM